MLGNINILRSLRSVCYYFSTGGEIPPCFDFYVVTRFYSSLPFLCALDNIDAQFKTTMKEGGHDSYN